MKIITGNTEVAEAQKPVPLSAGGPEITACLEIQIQADPSNTGALVAIGDKNVNATKTLHSTRGIYLEKGARPVRIEAADPSQIFVDAEKAEDCVTWIAVLA